MIVSFAPSLTKILYVKWSAAPLGVAVKGNLGDFAFSMILFNFVTKVEGKFFESISFVIGIPANPPLRSTLILTTIQLIRTKVIYYHFIRLILIPTMSRAFLTAFCSLLLCAYTSYVVLAAF